MSIQQTGKQNGGKGMDIILEEYGAMIIGVIAVVIMAGMILGFMMQGGFMYQLLSMAGEGIG